MYCHKRLYVVSPPHFTYCWLIHAVRLGSEPPIYLWQCWCWRYWWQWAHPTDYATLLSKSVKCTSGSGYQVSCLQCPTCTHAYILLVCYRPQRLSFNWLSLVLMKWLALIFITEAQQCVVLGQLLSLLSCILSILLTCPKSDTLLCYSNNPLLTV